MKNINIAIIGLGYVGLPLAVAFSKKFNVIGVDINIDRVNELNKGKDLTGEVLAVDLKKVIGKSLTIESNIEHAKNCNVFIVTVPTPVTKNKKPDLSPIILATKALAPLLKSGDIIVYESTVYPGVTEEICVPILSEISGLIYNHDFSVGYSPERINPGDKIHTLEKIVKVVSGSTNETLKKLSELYGSIIEAGIYEAPNIKTAEAAKVIENTQRDINIAFVNELAVIFSKMGINTNDVLKAATTKWNFLNFFPGLVGGHCIGVDPYYLAYKSEEHGHHPEIILAGRRINDGMVDFISTEISKLIFKNKIELENLNFLILGATFKENCPDLRNSKVFEIYNYFKSLDINVHVFDPVAERRQLSEFYNESVIDQININYDVIFYAVKHNEFSNIDLDSFLSKKGFIYSL